jgi:hypothetical protein
MKPLINPDYSINPHVEFILQGKRLRVVGTEGENKTILETIDTILNLETKKRTKVTRQKLKSFNIQNYEEPTLHQQRKKTTK